MSSYSDFKDDLSSARMDGGDLLIFVFVLCVFFPPLIAIIASPFIIYYSFKFLFKLIDSIGTSVREFFDRHPIINKSRVVAYWIGVFMFYSIIFISFLGWLLGVVFKLF